MKKFGGDSSENPKRIGDYLLEFCFDRRLLEQFSFTGMQKNRGIAAKPGFKKFPRTIRFIFNVIYSGHKDYTMSSNEKYLQAFFKKVCERGQKRRRTFESDDENEDVPAEKMLKNN